MGNPRIDELRRRVQSDPASIAFAQLAEEYRRAGQFDEAVAVCRTGLARHPGYLSARVTLGRALLELGEFDDAAMELQFVASSAPENLAAIRGIAEIHQRQGQLSTALDYYRRALALASHDPELEDLVQHLSRELGSHQETPAAGLSFEEAHDELLSAATRLPDVAPAPPSGPADGSGEASAPSPFDFDALLAALGTPPAPAQVGALLGQAPVAVGPVLPEVDPMDADGGDPGDPFAVLEADLRHYRPAPALAAEEPEEEAAHEPVRETALAGGEPVVHDQAAPPEAEAEVVEPRAQVDEPGPAAATAPVAAVLPAAGVEADDAQVPEWTSDVVDAAGGGPDAPALAAIADAGVPAPLDAEWLAVPATVAEAADPVLDELERWLAVLQERAGTTA